MSPLQNSTRAKRVALVMDEKAWCYPALEQAPFHPSEAYPEYGDQPLATTPNVVYDMVRRTLTDLGLDASHRRTANWNPIGDLVPPGGRIVVKPNWVNHRNPGAGGWECLITHPSVLRAVLDYVLLAKPSDVLIGDAPIQDCDFDRLLQLGVVPVIDYFRRQGAPIRLADFRRTTWQQTGAEVKVSENIKPLEDYVTVDIGSQSLLEPLAGDADRFRVTKYDPRKMKENHRPGVHRYLVARDILKADLIVNLPKLKTHKKAGLTAALKNLVGINGNKDYLPHHRKGPASSGHGDCYECFNVLKGLAEQLLDVANKHLDRPRLYRYFHKAIYFLLVLDMKLGGTGDVEGSWQGNDTLWRTCLDLNRLLLYADEEGRMTPEPQRVELSLVDALFGGDGEGPLKPRPCPLKAMIASLNPAACDVVCAALMRLKTDLVPTVARAFDSMAFPVTCFPISEIECSVGSGIVLLEEVGAKYSRAFVPSVGWRKASAASKEKVG